jgi:hypothetical protein
VTEFRDWLGLVLIAIASGCGEDYEHVSYDKPKPPPEVVVDVGHIDLDGAALPKEFGVPHLKPRAPVMFKGRVSPLDDPLRPRVMLVRFLRERPGRKPVTMGNKIGRLTETDDGLTYEVQLDAPRDAGTYTVQLTCIFHHTDAPDGDDQAQYRDIARATVRVQ